MDSDFERVQVNGQRWIRKTSGPEIHSNVGFEIFIQNLPYDLYEEELLSTLVRFGGIFELRVMMNFSGLTRGFAYAKYWNEKSALDAICGLHRREIRPGHRIVVMPSWDKKELFIGNLPGDMKFDEAVYLIKTLTANVADINICRRRSVIVKYETHQDAAKARRILIPNRVQIFRNEYVVIEWAGRKKTTTKHPNMRQGLTTNVWKPHANYANPSYTSNQPKFFATAASPGRPLRRTYDPPGPPAFTQFPTTNQMSFLECAVSGFASMNSHQFSFNN